MGELRAIRTMTTGDAAVSGLLKGMVGGAAMAGYMIIALASNGESPGEVLQRFGPEGGAGSPLTGAVSHLAIGAIYGMLFALVWRQAARRVAGWKPALLGGLLYALLLFALAQLVLLPAGRSPMLDVPVQFALAHMIYGLVLGYLHRPKG